MSADLVSMAELIGLRDSEHSDILANVGTSAPTAAATMPFRAAGIFNFSIQQGHEVLVTGSGRASPGGPFEFQDIVSVQVEHGVRLVHGTISLDFASGSTLSIYYRAPIENQVVQGPYRVVGGTGIFEGASGSGTIWYPIGQGEPFTLDGTLTG
jgi:hypothetical protein